MDDLQTHARTALEQVCARGDLDRARELYAEHFVDHVNTLEFHDLRAELTLLARWNLSSLERRSRLSRLVRRESAHFPPDLLERLYDRLVAEPYAQIVAWLQERFAAAGAEVPDLHAIAIVLTEPMSAYRSMRETFGRVLDDIDDERFIDGWVDVCSP